MSVRLGLLLVAVSATAAADPVTDISHCAAVSDRDARLACYDELGSRYAVKKGALAAPGTSAAASQAAAPVAAKGALAPTAPLAANSAPPAPSTAPTAAEQRADFGLQPNQKPKDPEAPKKITTIEGVVSGFGHAPNGHQVVRLDDSQSWELTDDADALLKPGDKVSIRRAMLGSFIMSTPSGREHRVKRLSP